MGMVMAIICLSKQFRLLLIDDIGTGERIRICSTKQNELSIKGVNEVLGFDLKI